MIDSGQCRYLLGVPEPSPPLRLRPVGVVGVFFWWPHRLRRQNHFFELPFFGSSPHPEQGGGHFLVVHNSSNIITHFM